jgi:glucose/arabinose dehydrogenase
MKVNKILFLACISFVFSSCYWMRNSHGGGQVKNEAERKVNVADIALPKGYKIELVAQGFTFPTAVAFDEQGVPYVIESGYAYGEVWTEPQLIRVDPGGVKQTIVKGTDNGPWTGITFHEGSFYVAEGGEKHGGKILKIGKDKTIKAIVENLPSIGDHHTNGPAIKDAYVYFGQGTATNSGIVGNDNLDFGWLKRHPEFHDIPCKDISLRAQNYQTANLLKPEDKTPVQTGAFKPFGTPSSEGEVIPGKIPCTGAVMRVPLHGGTPELVAWGLRNPYGLSFSPAGELFVTENAFDDRGSRPVWGAGDVLWKIETGKWYGWPDYSAGKSVVNDEEFKVPGKPMVAALVKDLPNTPPAPAAIFGVHSSSNGIDFSASDKFGYKGQAFVAQFGDMAPKVGKVLSPVGFKVVRVDVNNGVITDFCVNKGKKNGPATFLKKQGLERPLGLKFNPVDGALYLVDFGVIKITEGGPAPQKSTGVLWKISKAQ